MENALIEKAEEDPARLSCSSAIRNLEFESIVRGISPTRHRVLVLQLDDLLRHLMQWLNEFIKYKKLEHREFSFSEMYICISTQLRYHALRLVLGQKNRLVGKFRWIKPSVQRILFISRNINAYFRTRMGNMWGLGGLHSGTRRAIGLRLRA